MPKPTKGPRLGGSSSHQKAILANLATSLFEHGRIKTTEPKARALRPYAEKLITHAKKGTLHNRREVIKKIRDKDVVHTLVRRDRAVLRRPQRRLHPHHQGGGAQGRQRPDGRHRAGAGEDGDLEANRARRAAASKKAAPAKAAAPASDEAAGRPRRRGRRGSGRGDRRGGQGRRTPPSRRPRPPRPKPRSPRPRLPRPRRLTPTRMPTSPSSMSNEPAIDSGGGFVRLRLDIAYDGTDFAGWALQAGQRTVARRSGRRVVDGVPHAGAAACGGPHRRRRACDGSGGARRRVRPTRCRTRIREAEGRPALDPMSPPKRLRSSCRWCDGSRGSCLPTCVSSTSTVPQRVSTPGSRRCGGITSTGCRPPRTVLSRRRLAT